MENLIFEFTLLIRPDLNFYHDRWIRDSIQRITLISNLAFRHVITTTVPDARLDENK